MRKGKTGQRSEHLIRESRGRCAGRGLGPRFPRGKRPGRFHAGSAPAAAEQQSPVASPLVGIAGPRTRQNPLLPTPARQIRVPTLLAKRGRRRSKLLGPQYAFHRALERPVAKVPVRKRTRSNDLPRFSTSFFLSKRIGPSTRCSEPFPSPIPTSMERPAARYRGPSHSSWRYPGFRPARSGSRVGFANQGGR